MRKVVIRADSSIDIGSGHIVRCINLANELNNIGWEVHFLTNSLKGNLNYLIKKNGFNLHQLPFLKSDLNDYELKDAKNSKKLIDSIKPSLIIIDHYSLGELWENFIKSDSYKIAVIDDFTNRKHICDFFINQNFFTNTNELEEKLQKRNIKPLIGPKFSLLDGNFSKTKKLCKNKTESVKNIFIFFGGIDPDDVTSKVLKSLDDEIFNIYHFEVVIGSNNPNKDKLFKILKEKRNFTLHIQLENLANVMARSDIAICAGGSNTWERACLGLPSLVITLAENQVSYSKNLHESGYIDWLGNFRDLHKKDIYSKTLSLIKNFKKRKQMSELLMGMVDGFGAKRVAAVLTDNLLDKDNSLNKLSNLKNKKLNVTFLSDQNSWLNTKISSFIYELNSRGIVTNWCHDLKDINPSDICFILSFSKIIPKDILSKSKNNLVVHESDLPKGKGMSPMTWQILEGQDKISVSLIEASEEVDKGQIYSKRIIELEGHELVQEWRDLQAQTTFQLCLDFLINYPKILNERKLQVGEETFYKKRNPKDSELDLSKSLDDLFPKLRVVDNNKYPAFFKKGNYTYYLKIKKME
tara:strand:+ start:5967 stop:7709 length:1743 start_codon:yes stop_codon:yes gene_type:complete